MAQEITDAVIAQLEAGVDPWHCPHNAQGGVPRNATNERIYHGVNTFILWSVANSRGYTSNRWLTFQAAKAAGGSVRKGQNKANDSGGTPIVFFKWIVKEDKDTGQTRRIPFLRTYTLFNVEQCDGLPDKVMGTDGEVTPELSDEERIGVAEAFFTELERNSTVSVQEGGAQASYNPSLDKIRIPNFADYLSPEGFYSTKAHEHGHSTGHKTRLAREEAFGNRFGSSAYAYEELVAEMTAAFVCAHLGIERNLQHPEYIGHWIKVLRGDKKALFTAASQARKAVVWLLTTAGEPTDDWAFQSGPDAE
jgi:antirestriction protein ArdC